MAAREKYAKLFDIACRQGGVFSASQAVSAGFDGRNHPYYVRNGHWTKEHRGIYRLCQFPPDPAAQFAIWSLWSCARDGEPQGVYSHETALGIHELTDLNPGKLFMTVPLRFSKRAEIPKVLVLQRGKLTPKDWRQMGGYRVTTPVRTLYDIVNCARIAEEHIFQAVREGLSRGVYPPRDLAKYGLLRVIKRYGERNRG